MKRNHRHLIYEIPKEKCRGILPKINLLAGAIILLSLVPFMFWWTGYQIDLPFLFLALMFSSFAYVLYRLSLQYTHFAIYEKGITPPKHPLLTPFSLFKLPKKDYCVPYSEIKDIKVRKKFPFVFTFKLKNNQELDISPFNLAEYIKNDLRELRRIYDLLWKLTMELREGQRQEYPISVEKKVFKEILERNYEEIENAKTFLRPVLIIIAGLFIFFSGIVIYFKYDSLILGLSGLLIGFLVIIVTTLKNIKTSERGRREILEQWKRAEVKSNN